MAEKIGDAYVGLGVKDSEYNAKMAKAKMTFMDLFHSAEALKVAFGALIAGEIGHIAHTMMEAAHKSEQAEMDLAVATKFRGQSVEKMLPIYDAFAHRIQQTTTFDDEAVKSAMAFGLSLGISADKIQEATKAAVGMAAVTGSDLQGAMQALVKGNVGMVRQLKMYGVQLDENASAEENFNRILAQTGQLFQVAQARANTSAGALSKVAHAWDDVKEKLGRGVERFLQLEYILPALSDLLSKFGLSGANVEKVTEALKDVDIEARKTAASVAESEKKKQEAMKRTLSIMSAKDLWGRLAEAGLRFLPPKSAAASSTTKQNPALGPMETVAGPSVTATAGRTLEEQRIYYTPSFLPGTGANTVGQAGSALSSTGFMGGPAGSTLMPGMQRALDSDGGLKISRPSIKQLGTEIADRWRNTVFTN